MFSVSWFKRSPYKALPLLRYVPIQATRLSTRRWPASDWKEFLFLDISFGYSFRLVAQSNVVNSGFVIDDDKNSCLEGSGIISRADDFYYLLLQMTVKDADDLTGTTVQIDVVFNQAIACSGRQVYSSAVKAKN